MSRRASGRIGVVLDFNEEADSLGVGDAIARLRHYMDASAALANGTSDSGQIDRLYSANGTATSTPTDIDLSGSLASPLNAGSLVFADVSFILIQNTGTVALKVGGSSAPIPVFSDTTDILVVPPGGFALLYGGTVGYPVTATTADLLRLATASSSTTYKLIVGGRSA